MDGSITLSASEARVLDELLLRIPLEIQARGRSYANIRHIDYQGRDGGKLQAQIHGTNIYQTFIDVINGSSGCTCPAEKPCKHIAALARFIQHEAAEQSLFNEAPPVIDETLRLAVLVDHRGDISLAATDSRNRIYHLDAPAYRRLAAKDKLLVRSARKKTRLGRIEQYAFLTQLFTQNAEVVIPGAELPFYFGRSVQPSYFAGFTNVTYRLRNAVSAKEAEDEIRTHGYYVPEFELVLQADNPAHAAHDTMLFPDAQDSSRFFVSALLRDGLQPGVYDLTEVMQHPLLSALVEERIRHLWQKRASAGPRRSLYLYSVPKRGDQFEIAAEFGICYAHTEDAFGDNNPDGPIYSFIPAEYDYETLVERVWGRMVDNASPEETLYLVMHKANVMIQRNLTAELELLRKNPVPLKLPPRRHLGYFRKIIPQELKKGTVVRIEERIAGLFWPSRARIEIKESSGIDWFEGQIAIEGFDASEMREIMRAYRKQQPLVKLAGGRWVSVENLGITELMQSLGNIGLRTDARGRLTRLSRAQLLSLELEEAAALRTEAGAQKVIAQFRKFAATPPVFIEPPANFTATLRQYQKDGVAYLMKLIEAETGGILADDMGLGKTVQSIAAMTIVAARKPDARFLIVCPLAALGVWENEMRRFAPELKVYRSHGATRNPVEAKQAQVVVTSFATFALDAEKFAEMVFDVAFVDEAQFVKNHKTQAAAALRKIRAPSIICLSGTPVENHVDDLWALMDLAFPGYLGTHKAFKRAHGGKRSARGLEILRRKIQPFVLRRTKAQVLQDLPEKTETIIRVPMTTTQAKVYEAARRVAKQLIAQAGAGYSVLFEMLRHLTNLRRISCHPYLDDENADPLDSGKLLYLDEKFDDLNETANGVLIFSQFTSVLRVAERLLQKRGSSPLYLDGDTSEKRRRELVQKFQAGENKFFLISLRAGGTALTLTRADTVIHLDPWWNPAVENQASDRAHRIGQTRHVFVYKLVSEKTVEEKVLELQEKKRALFEALLGYETGQAAPALSREDMEFILGD